MIGARGHCDANATGRTVRRADRLAVVSGKIVRDRERQCTCRCTSTEGDCAALVGRVVVRPRRRARAVAVGAKRRLGCTAGLATVEDRRVETQRVRQEVHPNRAAGEYPQRVGGLVVLHTTTRRTEREIARRGVLDVQVRDAVGVVVQPPVESSVGVVVGAHREQVRSATGFPADVGAVLPAR